MRGFLTKTLPVLLISLILTALLGAADRRGFFDPFELRLIDFRFLARGNSVTPDPIVIVHYDEISFQKMEGWPWPRTYHAQAIDKLKAWGAKVIAFDQLFFDPSKMLPTDQDQQLASAMKRAGNVVIASKFDEIQQLIRDPQDPTHFTRLKTVQYLEPLPMFSEVAPVGYLNMIKDTDGYVRRIPMIQKAGDGVAMAFSLMAYMKYKNLGLEELHLKKNQLLQVGDLAVPLGKTNSMRISYCGIPGIFPHVSFYKILKDEVDPSMFRNKIVLIGPTALEFHDSFYTPYYGASRTEMTGVEIHANALATLLNRNFLKKASPALLWVSLLAYGLIVAGLASFVHPLRMVLWALLLTILQIFVSLHFFLEYKTIYPTAAGIVEIWSTYFLVTMYRTFVGERRERKLKSTFKRYVSKDVVDEILKSKSSVKLEGDKKKVTVLFSDIRGFTKMSEKMDPAVLIKELNEYFHDMIVVIFKHSGTLDKFIGDAIMAVWGSPLPHDNDALQAVKAAWDMQQAIKKLNERRAIAGKVPIQAGMGINTGEAVVGNLGSFDRMEFTVIGDTVNTASRIEHQTLPGQVLLHQSTYEEVKDFVDAVAIAPVTVKGKVEPLQLYNLLGIK